jgi:hypothetical protein
MDNANLRHNKRMQSDQSARYARTLAADARRYQLYITPRKLELTETVKI